MKRAALASIAVALAVLAGHHAAAASPTTFVVNSTGDSLDALVGDGRCATAAGMCTLRAAVAEANALPGADVIEVPAGTYEIGIPALNQNDIATGDLDITDSLTITGAGASSTIVDGGVPVAGSPVQVHGLDRLFEVLVDGGQVNFTGLTFSDGYAAEYGGAIMNNSTATVTVADSTFTGNVAGKSGGAIDNHLGGTVEVRNATLTGNFAFENGSALNNNRDGLLTVQASTVSSNSAADVGLDESLVGAGAITNNAELDLNGTIVVTDSVISENRAGGGRSGATISNDGAGAVTVERTTFSKNIATGNGGAIFNSAGAVSVADSTFSENAGESGGAIFNGVKEGRVTVSGSSFSLNTAASRGGAIASAGGGILTVLDSTFSKNSADDWGGAILNDDKGSATILGSTFRENSGLNGGAFANEGTGLVTIEHSTFTNNTAFATAVLASGEGGGMHTNSVGEVVIAGGEFTGNDAHSGGGLSNEGGGTLVVTGTRFSGNTAEDKGGGILIQSGAVRMLDIDVIGNAADGALEAGGGIAYEGDKLVSIGESAAIEGSRIRDNRAKGQGGGIDSRGDGPLSIATTTIAGNTAGAGGGIHHVGDAPLDVMRSTLSGNLAETGGGLFTDGDGETGIENTTVSGNRAGQFGGGLLVSSRLTIRSSTVADNSAPSGGGINNGGGDLVGDGSVYLLNTIVANSPTGGNCAGTMTSLGGNLESGDSCELRELSDQPGTDPLLGPLTDNGGPTLTHELLADSPAQERAVCTEIEPCPPVDQRGVARPLFGGVDVGAFESERPPGGGGPGQQCTGRMERPVPADFDSWVSQGAPSANFGSDATLKVESKPSANDRALVHFALPPVPPGCKLVGASLRLYSSSATDGHTLEALRVAGDWTELGATWANQPATAGPAATTQSGLGLREWDVLAQALDMYALGNHGFLIRDADENGSGEQSFHSTEKGTDNPPQLVLVFDDPDAPPRPVDCPTTPQSISADRDAWVSEGSPSNNFGSDSTLKVKSQLGYNSRALFRFPLPALPAGCTSIASAALRVEAASAKDGRTLDAVRVASDWSEAGVTWSNQPATAGLPATVPSAEGPLEWAVTDQVLEMYTSANHGFLIRDAEENGVGDEQTLHSRDKLNDSPPELVLVFDDTNPDTTIDSGPMSPTDSTEASFEFSSDRSDATFECSLDRAAFRTCSSPYTVAELAEGDHRLEVRALRPVRAIDPTAASYEWTVAVPPETFVAGPASPSASPDAVLVFSSDDPDASFECSLDDAPFAACTSPVEYTGLADGEHGVRVRAVDPHRNADPTPAAHSWIVAVPPETTISGGPADPTNSTSASLSFDADEPAGFECALDAGDWEPCTSPVAYADLADGRRTVRVRATDRAGNVDPDPATHTWTVDTTAPELKLTTVPSDPSNDPTPTFEYAGERDTTVSCSLDGTALADCGSPLTLGPLPDGSHTFELTAADAAGNSAGASYTWTVDTTAPQLELTTVPDDPSNDATPTFEYAGERDATVSCSLDGTALIDCGSPLTLEPGDGSHTLELTATDAAGNSANASYTWTTDTTAPELTLTTVPSDPSNDATPTFEYAIERGATLTCSLDGVALADCGSPLTLEPGEGSHALELTATDAAGNSANAGHAWAIDTAAPDLTLTTVPADPSNDPTPTFEYASERGATITCSVDGTQLADCGSPLTLEPGDGSHALELTATDAAGNSASASYAWTVDTTAPELTLTTVPADPSNDATPTFEYTSERDATVSCSLNGTALADCGSPLTLEPGDGSHTLELTATDAAGNSANASYSWTVDTVRPAVTIDAGPADPTKDRTATFKLAADEPASLECRLDTGDWGACTTPHEIAGPLPDGRHTFEARATDLAGNTGAPVGHTWTIDTVAPDTTIGTAPLALSNHPSATFEFTADELADFECRLGNGEWTACASPHAIAGPLPDGAYGFEVRATDKAGNTGAPASHGWTIDTVAPTVTIDAAPRALTNDPFAIFEFSADERASFECRLDTGEWATCTSPHRLDHVDGEHTFEVHATDGAGNTSVDAAYTWTVDTTAPTAKIDAGPADVTNRTTASLEFSADEAAGFQCRLDTGDWAACTSPHEIAGPLTDGAHAFDVRASDVAGNTGGAATHFWIVDTVAPDTTIQAAPPELSNDRSPTFEFAADELASFECRLDGGDWVGCAGPHAIAGPLGDGRHSFEVRATDPAGNTGAAATHSWTVDTAAPTTKITDGPADPTNRTSATFDFSADETAGFQCRLDTGDWISCTSPHPLSVADGRHTLEVRAADPAGNTGAPATYTWTVDTTAPTATIDSADELTLTFAFSAGEPARFECRVDAADWAACTSPHEITGPLADGDHTFQVRATDAAGNTGEPAGHRWTIDTIAPTTTIDAAPRALSNEPSATFEFSADERASFECRVDEGAWAACTSPHPLAVTDGRHTFHVRASDSSGNTGAFASYTWTVDTRAPITTIDSAEASSATFRFSADEPAGFECKLDSGDWGACASPHSYPALTDGQHVFQVRATDAAGNTGAPAAHTWTRDTGAPAATIVSRPADRTNDASASFAFASDEPASFECTLDAGDWAACSSPRTYEALADGEHTFQVRAADAAGNTGAPATHTWTIDTRAPIATIVLAPAALTNESSTTFGFVADEPATFDCKLGSGDWAACSSPHTYEALANGEHTFQVRGADAAGNTGAPAVKTWTIDTRAPIATIDSADERAAAFAFSADEAAGFECKLDGGDWTACTSPHEVTGPLADGDHTFQVRATDPAGNTGAAATHTWTIDTLAPAVTIVSAPADPSDSSSASFTFTAGEAGSFECKLDTGDWTPCDSPKTYTGLADGLHSFGVRATDRAGNTGEPASHTWTIDTTVPDATAPDTSITDRPSDPSGSGSATFRFTGRDDVTPDAELRFECRLDGALWLACSSPSIHSGLGDGSHTFEVRAVDLAGNVDPTPASASWTIDTAPPQTTITNAPPSLSSSTSASFSFMADAPGSRFECSLDGAPYGACTSPAVYSGLAAGSHQFGVRATDPAGNTDPTPAIHTWTISIAPACGQAATAVASADAWIDENSPTSNKGTDSILKVQSKGPRDNFRAAVRFPLPAIPAGCAVQSATLRLYAASSKPGRTLHAFTLASAWTESQVSWVSQLLTTGSPAVTTSGLGYREWVVTTQVQAMYQGPNHGFLIRDAVEGQDAEQQFHSREKGSNMPQLVLRFTPAG